MDVDLQSERRTSIRQRVLFEIIKYFFISSLKVK